MIENEVKTTSQVTVENSTVTSPISKDDKKQSDKKTNAFMAWLKDEDTVDEKNGEISAKEAVTSYGKGLIEVVKTVYKKPLAAAITIATGAVITFYAHVAMLTIVMSAAAVAGAAGVAYACYNIVSEKTSNNTKLAYEILGISTFVLGLGIYGLFI